MDFIKLGKGNSKGGMADAGGTWRQREPASLLWVLLKLRLTYGKERTR
jgi:hypothetical protein